MAVEFDVVVAGYTGLDLAPAFGGEAKPLEALLRPGKLVEVGPLAVSLGGVVPNTGLALSRFGMRVALMGLVGQDQLGDLLLGLLDRHEATLHLRRTEVAGTAYGLVIAPPGSDRVFWEYPGCNATFTATDLDYEVIAQSRLFHFGYPPLMPALLANNGAELARLFRRVQGLGVITSLDMTLPDPDGSSGQVDWPALLTRVLPQVDVFTPSLEELLYMLAPQEWARDGEAAATLPTDRLEALAQQALDLGAGVVFLKCGARGAYLCSGSRTVGLPAGWLDQSLWLAPLPVDGSRFRNACGAGDAAVAGLLAALLRGEPATRAGALAMVAGRDSLYGVDALSGLRSWQEL